MWVGTSQHAFSSEITPTWRVSFDFTTYSFICAHIYTQTTRQSTCWCFCFMPLVLRLCLFAVALECVYKIRNDLISAACWKSVSAQQTSGACCFLCKISAAFTCALHLFRFFAYFKLASFPPVFWLLCFWRRLVARLFSCRRCLRPLHCKLQTVCLNVFFCCFAL